jgi:RNA polymerase sigma factor (sigma-70 family)
MMAPLSDEQLLEQFRQRHDPGALGEIVRRYAGLVNRAARRQVRDAHLADDVTQAVFIVLVRKADSIRPDTLLPAWLFTVTRHAVANARRVAARRRAHETTRAMMDTDAHAPRADVTAETADQIRHVLDDGIARLSRTERTGVIMHFLGGKSHREVGAALGIGEEAARKRTTRAVEKLREFLGICTRGAVASGAAVVAVMSAEREAGAAYAAQPPLVESMTNVALVANSTAAPAATATVGAGAAVAIARGALRAIRTARVKLAAGAAVLLLLALLTATSLVALARRAAAPAPARAHLPLYAINLDARTNVRILGVSPYPPDARSWFAPDGTPVDLPDERLLDATAQTAVPPQYVLAARVANPGSELVRLGVQRSVAGANVLIPDGDGIIVVCLFSFMNVPDRATVELGLADSAWRTTGSFERPVEGAVHDVYGFGSVRFERIRPNDTGGTNIVIRHGRFNDPYQLVVIDEAGAAHAPLSVHVASFPPPDVTTTCTFDVSPDEVARLLLQAKPFTRFVDGNEISLRAGNETRPTLRVRDGASR